MNFRIDKKWFLAESGDSLCISVNVKRELEILEDSVVFELLSLIRPNCVQEN